jgi:hypothetical protein
VPRLRRHARGGYTEGFYGRPGDHPSSISDRPTTTTSSTAPRSRAAAYDLVPRRCTGAGSSRRGNPAAATRRRTDDLLGLERSGCRRRCDHGARRSVHTADQRLMGSADLPPGNKYAHQVSFVADRHRVRRRRSGATTTRTARTTRSAGSTGRQPAAATIRPNSSRRSGRPSGPRVRNSSCDCRGAVVVGLAVGFVVLGVVARGVPAR